MALRIGTRLGKRAGDDAFAQMNRRVEAVQGAQIAMQTAIEWDPNDPNAPDGLDVVLETIGALGSTAEVFQESVENAEKNLKDLREARVKAIQIQRGSNTSEPVLDELKLFPNTIVKNIAKAADRANNEFKSTFKILIDRLDDAIGATEKYLKTLPSSKVLKFADNAGDAADFVKGLRDGVEALRTFHAEEINDLEEFTQSLEDSLGLERDNEDVPEIELPESVQSDFQDAMDAFGKRFDYRVDLIEDVKAIFDRIGDAINTVISVFTGPIGDLANFLSELIGDTLGSIDDAFTFFKNAGTGLINSLNEVLSPIFDVIGVLRSVQDAVQPVLDFFGPIIGLINGVIDGITNALGLNKLADAVGDAVGDAISKIVDPLFDQMSQIVDALTNGIFEVFQSLAEDFIELKNTVVDMLINPVALVGDVYNPLTDEISPRDDLLEGRSMITGRAGEDQIRLELDDRFDDGHGGLAIGDAGNDQIWGTNLKDVLVGGADNDNISAHSGDDIVFGGTGNDTLFGGDDNDRQFGDAGDDGIFGGNGDDESYGDAGNDELQGGAGNDTLDGEDGDDILLGGVGNDTLEGGTGNDTLKDGDGNDMLFGGDGIDNISASAGFNTIEGGDGVDRIITHGERDAVHKINDATASLTGGAGVDHVFVGDAYADGSANMLANMDGGANRDIFEAGSLDLIKVIDRIEGFETIRITSDGSAKTFNVDSTEFLRGFDKLEFGGTGPITWDVRAGEIDLNVMFTSPTTDPSGNLVAAQPMLVDFSAMTPVQNPQDGEFAGDPSDPTDGRPASLLSNLTIQLHSTDGEAGRAIGSSTTTLGMTFLGSVEGDTIVGGSGSDIIRGGLGADDLNGSFGDRGDQFNLDSAVGDVIIGTVEELDGDTIRNLSNRVDRVRIEGGEDYAIHFNISDTQTVVSVYHAGTDVGAEGDPAPDEALASFTLIGEYPKIISRTLTDPDTGAVTMVEILNNNVPPTAVDDEYRTLWQGRSDPLLIDPFGNDFDVDTAADPDAGIVRRQIALDESLSSLFRVIDIDEIGEDAARAAFADGSILAVAVGTELRTELGNKLIFTADGIVYEARLGNVPRENYNPSEIIPGAPDRVLFNTLTDIPFFGHDRIEYQVFDLEGELSNTASIDILVRPEFASSVEGSVIPRRGLFGIRSDDDDAFISGIFAHLDPDASALGEMVENTGFFGTERVDQFSEAAATVGGAYQGNDWFDINQTSGPFLTYSGRSGNDALLADGSTVPVALLGGLNADWLEGGSADDLLIGGGVGDKKLRIELSNAGDQQVLPDILLGGAGNNVFTANFEAPIGPLNNSQNPYDARESIYVLDGGAEIITGAISDVSLAGVTDVNSLTFRIGFGAAGSAGPTASTAAGLDNDLVKGFDGDDRIVVPFDLTSLSQNTFTEPEDDSLIDFTLDVPAATGLVVTTLDFSEWVGAETNAPVPFGTRGDTTLLDTFFGNVAWNSSDPALQLDIRSPFSRRDRFDLDVTPNPNFNAFPAILSYDVSATAIDPITGGAVPQTSLTVTMRAFAFEQRLIASFDSAEPFHEVATWDHRFLGTLRENNRLIDPAGLYDDGPVTFTIDLDGQYRDRFEVDFVPILESTTAPFIHTGDVLNRINEPEFGGYEYTHIDRGDVASFTDDAPLGLSIRYVSEAPVGAVDSASVESGTAQSFNVLINDTDADGDTLQIFDVLADDAYFDGNAANGEIFLETDLNTGFGSGVVTFVAPEDFVGDASFQYILTDGEFETGPIDVFVSVTEEAPLVSDRLIVLEENTDGVILLEEFIDLPAQPAQQAASRSEPGSKAASTTANSALSGFGIGLDVDDAGFTVDGPLGPGRDEDREFVNAFELFTETVTDPDGNTSEVVAGVKITDEALPLFVDDSFNETGQSGARQAFTFTLTNEAGNASDEGTVTVAVASQLVLTEQGTLSIAEDTTVAIDVLSARSGGFGEIEILSVSQPVVEGTLDSAGSAQVFSNGMLFTPAQNLSGVTAELTVTVRDAIGNIEVLPVSIDITPVEDAPEVIVDGAVTPVLVDEDTPALGTITFNDLDTGGVFEVLDAAALTTDSGGAFELTETATPGSYTFTYTPDGDFAGVDSVAVDLVTPGTTDPARSAVVEIEVAEVNDAPNFLEEAQDPADPTPLNINGALELDLFGMANDIDGTLTSKMATAIVGSEGAVDVTLGDDGLITVTGTASGLAEVQITITDDDGALSETRSLFFDVNAGPEARDDRQFLLDAATPILIDALANDTDPDGTVGYRLDENGDPVFYDAAASLDPDGDDDFGTGTADETPGLLGTVVWSAADNAFLYTAPTDPALLGQTDVFYYEVEDDDGAISSAAVYIDLIAPGQTILRFGETGVSEALAEAEQFILGQTGQTVRGTATNLDGDEISGIGNGNLIEITDIAPIDLNLEVTRERAPLPDDLSGQEILDGLSAAALIGTASQDELKQAFIGDTLLTLSSPGGSAELRLTGALLGGFEISDNGEGGSALAYVPGGFGEGSAADDDLRAELEQFQILTGLEGDDILSVLSVAVVGALSGGPGQDVFNLGSGPGTRVAIGGPDADLFILGNSGQVIVDFNPFEGDRLLITDQAFLNEDQTVDVERLRLVSNISGTHDLLGNPNERDDDGNLLTDLPEVPLAVITVDPGIDASAAFDAVDQGQQLGGDLSGSVSGLEGEARTFELVSGPTFGALAFNADGTYAYTPDSNYFGGDSFQYSVTVDTAIGPLTKTATVSLAVEPEFAIEGSPLNDDIVGSVDGEEISGLAGNDTLEALSGNDVLYGGDGNDIVSGGVDDDTLYGDSGNDTLNGGTGNDTLDGGLGDDRFFVDSVDDVVIEDAGEGTDNVTTSVDFTLPEHVERGSSVGIGDIAITGNAGANFITGNAGNNTLRGEAGADRLRGGDGNDTLEGGADNDILEGQAGSDRIVFGANNGDDQIIGWEASTDVLDFDALGLRFADLRLTSSGNEALITFDDPAGGTGSVRLIDIDPEVLEIGIVADPGGVGSPGGIPLLAGTSVGDNLTGTAAGEDLIGLAGNDTLNGRAGDDTMLGGFGDDRYFLDDAGDLAIEFEAQGIDQVDTRFSLILADNIERGAVRGGGAVDITGNALDNFITGSELTNVLIGGDGRDRLIARGGDDTLAGGLDNDVLEGGAGADVFVFEADTRIDLITDFVVGEDLLDVSALGIAFADLTIVDGSLGALVIFDLTAGSVDLVQLQGISATDVRQASFIGAPNLPIIGTAGNDVLRGTIEDDELQGLGGEDRLDGLNGADTLIGGPGDDRYFIDNVGDVVVEVAGEGTDLVTTSVDFTLLDHVEDLNTQTDLAVDLTGNGLANLLNGNDASNVLTGLAGDDNLQGKGGADVIDGGVGADVLRGGADADTFLFETGDGPDQIIDFEVGTDSIDLSATGLGFGDLTIQSQGTNAMVQYGSDSILFQNMDANLLSNTDFIFGMAA